MMRARQSAGGTSAESPLEELRRTGILRGMKIPAEPKVILRSCRDYDPERIRTIIREGLEELGLKPAGRTLVKPNLVASGPMFPHAYTRPEFGEGVLRALRDVGGSSMTALAAGERCGSTVPTRGAVKEPGWRAT